MVDSSRHQNRDNQRRTRPDDVLLYLYCVLPGDSLVDPTHYPA